MDEINSLKVEVEMLKNKIKTIDTMKQERNVLTKHVAELREEVEILREKNIETAYKIVLLEEEFESDYDCEEENLHNAHCCC